ncbi:MAG: response regulator [Gemmatimonadales bacterium]
MPVRVLLVEDNPTDVEYVEALFRRGDSAGFTLARAACLAEALERIGNEPFDVALLDLGLPDSIGLDGFRQLHAAAPDVAIVVLSGHRDRDTAIDAVRLGAQDYLLKGHLDAELLIRSVRYALERKRHAARLKSLMDELQELYDQAPLGYLSVAMDGTITRANRSLVLWLGYRREDVVGRLKLADLVSSTSARSLVELTRTLLREGYLRDVPVDFTRRDGATDQGLVTITALSDAWGNHVGSRFTVTFVPGWVAEAGAPDEALDGGAAPAAPPGSMLPICVSCKRIEEEGVWLELEQYLRELLSVDLTHTLCPECARRSHPQPPRP